MALIRFMNSFIISKEVDKEKMMNDKSHFWGKLWTLLLLTKVSNYEILDLSAIRTDDRMAFAVVRHSCSKMEYLSSTGCLKSFQKLKTHHLLCAKVIMSLKNMMEFSTFFIIKVCVTCVNEAF